MGKKEKLAMLLTETHSNRDFYEAIAATDPCFGYDSEASPALAIFKATGQTCPYPNTALHAMQTIMIDDPNVDRTDPTYVAGLPFCLLLEAFASFLNILPPFCLLYNFASFLPPFDFFARIIGFLIYLDENSQKIGYSRHRRRYFHPNFTISSPKVHNFI